MRQCRRCRNYGLCLGLIFLFLLNLYSFLPSKWRLFHKSNFEDIIKQGTIIYNNTRLIGYVKNNFLIPPLRNHQQKIKSDITYFSQFGQDKFVDDLLNQTRNGFFIEAGAYDGEELSNTLFFERERHWTGLLIEPNPHLFKVLQCRQRNAWLSNTCISTIPYAVEVNFTFADYLSGQSIPNDKSLITGNGVVQCFPLMTYFLALNISHVNYFSLDIEGGEFDVLKQIDFKRIQIDIFTIEYTIRRHRSGESVANLINIRDFLLGTGLYEIVTVLNDLDAVFIRTSL